MRLLFTLVAALCLGCVPDGERDSDHDGVLRAEDCDDDDASIGAPGVFYLDEDGDGYGGSSSLEDCEQPEHYVPATGDCDDDDDDVHPGANEDCDHVDDDCDGEVDEGLPTQTFYEDLDGDLYGNPEGPVDDCKLWPGQIGNDQDCDDGDAEVHPGAIEVCNGVDDDCNGLEDDDAVDMPTWYADTDHDGFGDHFSAEEQCDQPTGYTDNQTDCDDTDPAVSPDADEVCHDGIDNDCDGLTDDPTAVDASTWYQDADHDHYGDPDTSSIACDAPDHYVANAEDCDDSERELSPDTPWFADADGDGFGDPHASVQQCEQPSGYLEDDEDCDDTDADVNPDADEECDDETDNDCDGLTDDPTAVDATTWYLDTDGDGYGDPDFSAVACDGASGFVANDDDCDDGEEDINPDAVEVCDDADNDCDGATDDDDADVVLLTWYYDGDGDGFGDDDITSEVCDQPSGYVEDGGDCDDDDDDVNPDAIEYCDGGIDNDCDGDVDEDDADSAGDATWYADADGDGYGDPDDTWTSCEEPSGYVLDGQDCDDEDEDVNPAAEETCNDGIDNDCDDSPGDCALDGDLALADDADAVFNGDAKDDYATFVSAAGDVDGDGAGDILIGAYGNDDGGTSAGAAYLFLGGAAGDFDVGSDADAIYTGDTAGIYLGLGLGAAGDVDGDGYDDVLLGAVYDSSSGYSQSGSVGLFYGSSSPSDADYSDADVFIEGTSTSGWVGVSVDGAGDMDGDGYADFIAGGYGVSSYRGAVYLFLGGSSLSSSMDTSDAEATLKGVSSYDQAGYRVSGGGDTDGDGYFDLLIAAPGEDSGGTTAGAAYVVLGGTLSGSMSLSSADAMLTGVAAGDTAGTGVDIDGDTDGDGYDDVLVAASNADDGGTGSGSAYLLLGPVDSDRDLEDADTVFAGESSTDRAGVASFVPDSDGDGLDELVVGARGADYSSATEAGRAYLFLGEVDSGSVDLSEADTILGGESTGDWAGYWVAGVPDTNGDGLGEILVGAALGDGCATDSGTAYMFYGTGM